MVAFEDFNKDYSYFAIEMYMAVCRKNAKFFLRISSYSFCGNLTGKGSIFSRKKKFTG